MTAELSRRRILLAGIVGFALAYTVLTASVSPTDFLRPTITELFGVLTWALATLDAFKNKWKLSIVTKVAGFSIIVDALSYFYIDMRPFDGQSIGFVAAGLVFMSFIVNWILFTF